METYAARQQQASSWLISSKYEQQPNSFQSPADQMINLHRSNTANPLKLDFGKLSKNFDEQRDMQGPGFNRHNDESKDYSDDDG